MIPEFDHSGVLPPFLGDAPGRSPNHAPYRSDIASVVERFGHSPERLEILAGLLRYRARLAALGIVEGFQWIDGSFVEDCEARRGRPPKDVDIVTFMRRPPALKDDDAWAEYIARNEAAFDELFSPQLSKQSFHCDAYVVELDIDVISVIEQAHFWFGLFSHSRIGRQWKGIVQISLFNDRHDRVAGDILARRRTPCSPS